MQGLDGVIQRLVEERDEQRASAQEAMLNAKVLDQAIEAIRDSINNRGQDDLQKSTPTSHNPFQARTVAYDVYEVLYTAEAPLVKADIHQRVSKIHPWSMNGISTVLYKYPARFHHTDDGTWTLVVQQEIEP